MTIVNAADAENALKEDWNNTFITQNLHTLASLEHLQGFLENALEDVYNYHKGNSFNHFSEWIKAVFGDPELALELFDASREDAAQIIKKRIEWLKKGEFKSP